MTKTTAPDRAPTTPCRVRAVLPSWCARCCRASSLSVFDAKGHMPGRAKVGGTGNLDRHRRCAAGTRPRSRQCRPAAHGRIQPVYLFWLMGDEAGRQLPGGGRDRVPPEMPTRAATFAFVHRWSRRRSSACGASCSHAATRPQPHARGRAGQGSRDAAVGPAAAADAKPDGATDLQGHRARPSSTCGRHRGAARPGKGIDAGACPGRSGRPTPRCCRRTGSCCRWHRCRREPLIVNDGAAGASQRKFPYRVLCLPAARRRRPLRRRAGAVPRPNAPANSRRATRVSTEMLARRVVGRAEPTATIPSPAC